MKLFYLFSVLAVLFCGQNAFATLLSSDCVINSTLKIGSFGSDVQCLQQKIGITADGSFGPLTKASVVAFQAQKGLVADGVVGSMTRGSLNSYVATLPNNADYPLGCTSITGYSPTTGAKCDGGLSPAPSMPMNDSKTISSTTDTTVAPSSNPNLVNMDQFIAKVVEVNKKNGSSSEELKLIADTLKTKIVNSNVDFNKRFQQLLENESKLSSNLNTSKHVGFFDKFLSDTLSFLGVTPKVAQAAIGTPFGGMLLFSYDACLNYEFLIYIEPLPPTYVALLGYIPGTQGFASYNIPFTSWLLGTYSGVGICVLDYYPYVAINAEGLIQPMTGSSPL